MLHPIPRPQPAGPHHPNAALVAHYRAAMRRASAPVRLAMTVYAVTGFIIGGFAALAFAIGG